MYYSSEYSYKEDYIKIINKKINALRYIKAEKDNTLESYKIIDVEGLKEVYCNDDWYIISYKDGKIEVFNNSILKNTSQELDSIILQSVKRKKTQV